MNIIKMHSNINLKIFILLIISLLFSCSNENNRDIVYKNDPYEFVNIEFTNIQDIMSLNDSFLFEGSESSPLYSVENFLAFNDRFFVLDKVNHRIFEFNEEGEEINSWGREGSGPGEFMNAEHFITGKDSLIYILDGSGNLKVHSFTADGQVNDTFPLRSFGPFTQSHFIEIEYQPVLVTTTNAYCKDQPGESCIIQMLDLEGNVVHSFAEIKQVQPIYVGVTFHSTIQNGMIYVVHFLGEAIAVYDLEGNYKYHIPIQQSPHITRPDIANFPADVYQQVSLLNNSSYTSITGLYSNQHYLIIEYVRYGVEYEHFPTRFFLDFYDFEGRPIYRGVNTTYPLRQVEGEYFYFAEYSEEEFNGNYGKVIIEKYIYNRTKEN